MSGLSEHAAKLVGRLSHAAADQAVCRHKFKGADNSLRVKTKLDAHRQQFGAHYWKLRNYVEFLEASVSESTLEAARSLPGQRGEDTPDV
ncbi:hypothetical protein [Methylorubrum extorquens]|uniref:Uncharacterized protein n=1 Tax=Methylorubrum extorquens DSM 13060 TaxID=882800 RepID=H1KCB1_METEX|nr:hypothetical protein [Methylorubrum extorquens]EHP94928.1 hypothetical protein MetexDRAFT_0273 [Methylorubrum extorquens DSM 13060]